MSIIQKCFTLLAFSCLTTFSVAAQPKPIEGSIDLTFRDGGTLLPVAFVEKEGLGSYQSLEEMVSGKRIHLSVNVGHQPVFVYVLASDADNNVVVLYASKDRKQSPIEGTAMPLSDALFDFQVDDHAGTDFLCVLFSSNQLEIQSIEHCIKKSTGSFYRKLATALGKQLATLENTRYVMNRMDFTTIQTDAVVPFIVEMAHRGINLEQRK